MIWQINHLQAGVAGSIEFHEFGENIVKEGEQRNAKLEELLKKHIKLKKMQKNHLKQPTRPQVVTQASITRIGCLSFNFY
jgi:hypothetical protein